MRSIVFGLLTTVALNVSGADVHFVDAGGNGACVILSAGHVIVVGAGRDRIALAEYLGKLQVTRIDLLILPEQSIYGFGGLHGLIERKVKVAEYWDAGFDEEGRNNVLSYVEYMSLVEQLTRTGTRIVRPLGEVHRPAALTGRMEWFSPGSMNNVRFCLLYARSSNSFFKWPCLTLLIEVDGVRLFFSGHSENPRGLPGDLGGVEQRLLDLEQRIPGALHAAVMVMPWMGSPFASSPRFISAVAPQVAISSPDEADSDTLETLERYRDARVMTTSIHLAARKDNILCVVDQLDFVCSYGAPDPRFWNGLEVNGKAITINDVFGRLALPDKPLNGLDLRGLTFDKSLAGANLKGTDLSFSDLRRADLTGAHLEGANLSFSQLDGARLRNIFTDGTTSFHGVHAAGTDFTGARLARSDFGWANLSNSNFTGADATGANLVSVDLRNAALSGATLTGAGLSTAKLDGALWELHPGGVPPAADIAFSNLESLRTEHSQHALIELRDAMKKSGLSEQGRLLTYEIQHRERLREDANGHWVESKFKLLLFEWPVLWGRAPARPLRIIGVLWLLFAIVYFAMIRAARHAGLRLVVTRRRRHDPTKNRVHVRRVASDVPRGFVARVRFEARTFLTALTFSFRNTLNLKFQWLDAGTWVRMLQQRDFEVEGLGWARTIAGVQSLVSLYLIAMSLLTYFGNPFD